MSYRIEPFGPEMTRGVIDLILPIQQREFGVEITLADQPDLGDIPGFYQKGAGGFWIAISQEAIIGAIALIDIGGGLGALRKMFVASNHRGKEYGVAAGLLKTLLDHARNQGMSGIYLGTTPMMAGAHRFYEKNGFQEIASVDLPENFPVMAVDKRFYYLGL